MYKRQALAQASRKDPRLAVGLSPRATLALASMTRAAAYLAGRDFVAPQDVTAVFDAVARHRLVLNDQARAGGETVDSVMPVSYTHLDVYKRQVVDQHPQRQNRCAVCGPRRSPAHRPRGGGNHSRTPGAGTRLP